MLLASSSPMNFLRIAALEKKIFTGEKRKDICSLNINFPPILNFLSILDDFYAQESNFLLKL